MIDPKEWHHDSCDKVDPTNFSECDCSEERIAWAAEIGKREQRITYLESQLRQAMSDSYFTEHGFVNGPAEFRCLFRDKIPPEEG